MRLLVVGGVVGLKQEQVRETSKVWCLDGEQGQGGVPAAQAGEPKPVEGAVEGAVDGVVGEDTL